MGKWTPEPWRAWDAYDIVGPNNRTVINDDTFWKPADRDRAVACVNALAGLNPEAVSELIALVPELTSNLHCGCDLQGDCLWCLVNNISDKLREVTP